MHAPRHGDALTGALRTQARRILITLFLAFLLFLPLLLPAAEVDFNQETVPLGLFSIPQRLEVGIDISTTNAPRAVGERRFAYWTLNGTAHRDELDRAKNPVAFRLLENTTAVAHYVDSGADANTNGIADWWEQHLFTNLATQAGADGEADDLTDADEFYLDLQPAVADRLDDGGYTVAFGLSKRVIANTNLAVYTVRSDPLGMVPITETITNIGSVLSVPALHGIQGEHAFIYWTLDGVVQTDALGQAVSTFSFTLLSNMTAEARFIGAEDDLDGDGLLDWLEISTLGSTNASPAGDADGDGFSVADELYFDLHPKVPDAVDDGGYTVAFGLSERVIANTNLAVFTQCSDPLGILTTTEVITNKGTSLTLPDLYGEHGGQRFAYWDLNGVIQTDGVGRAASGLDFTLASNTTATAHFVPPEADEDGDGMLDWLEWNYFGTTNLASDSDGDGDGFRLGDELALDLHPGVADDIDDGGYTVAFGLATRVIADSNLATFAQFSEPLGLVPTLDIVTNIGATLTLPPQHGINGNHAFTHWAVNGAVQTDALGRAVSGLTFTLESNTTAVAHHIAADADSDSDGILDWMELDYFGNTNTTPDSDTDSDGFTVGQEIRFDLHPSVRDTVADGGYTVAFGLPVTVNLDFFPRVTDALADGAPATLFSISPPATGTVAVAANSHPAVGDWDGDGDLDLFVGGSNGVMRIFENAGSPQVMNLVERTTNFAALASLWAGITNPAPALGDWTGDGCADLAVGGETGGVRLVVSPGSFHGDALTGALPTEARESIVRSALVRASPLGRERGTHEAGESPVRSVPVRAYPSPRKIPPYGGTTNRYTKNPRANVRSAPVRAYPPPAYALTGTLQTNVHVGTSLSIPAFGDLDGDGWADLLVLGEDGRVRFSPHTQNPALPYAESPADADLLKSAVPDATGIATADVNEDGVVDVLISDDGGNVWEFHGSGAGP